MTETKIVARKDDKWNWTVLSVFTVSHREEDYARNAKELSPLFCFDLENTPLARLPA